MSANRKLPSALSETGTVRRLSVLKGPAFDGNLTVCQMEMGEAQ